MRLSSLGFSLPEKNLDDELHSIPDELLRWLDDAAQAKRGRPVLDATKLRRKNHVVMSFVYTETEMLSFGWHFSLLATPQVVIVTTYGATSAGNFIKMTFLYQGTGREQAVSR